MINTSERLKSVGYSRTEMPNYKFTVVKKCKKALNKQEPVINHDTQVTPSEEYNEDQDFLNSVTQSGGQIWFTKNDVPDKPEVAVEPPPVVIKDYEYYKAILKNVSTEEIDSLGGPKDYVEKTFHIEDFQLKASVIMGCHAVILSRFKLNWPPDMPLFN